MSASITAWICWRFPAVILLTVQHASFLTSSPIPPMSFRKYGSTPQLMMTCVWQSSPVTMLPTALSAADTTVTCGKLQWQNKHLNVTIFIIRKIGKLWNYSSNSTSRRHIPVSITACIFSLGPSDKYDIAQQASLRTSGSLWNNKWDNTCKPRVIILNWFNKWLIDTKHNELYNNM